MTQNIQKILVVGQGPNDLGFLEGFRKILNCEAKLLDYETSRALRQRGSFTRRKDAARIWEERGDIDLIIRLTDSDQNQPQRARIDEMSRWPSEARDMLIVGVCNRDIEHWLLLDAHYLGKRLDFDSKDLPVDRVGLSGFVKSKIKEKAIAHNYKDFVAKLVEDAPSETIRLWLRDAAFADFYDECRRVAKKHDCPIPNLRERSEGN